MTEEKTEEISDDLESTTEVDEWFDEEGSVISGKKYQLKIKIEKDQSCDIISPIKITLTNKV